MPCTYIYIACYFCSFVSLMMFTLVKGLVKSLSKKNRDPSTIFSLTKDGPSVLHLAAYQGHLEVCKYLVEDLGGDVNAPAVGDGGGGFSLTSFRISIFGRCHIHVWLSEMCKLLLQVQHLL